MPFSTEISNRSKSVVASVEKAVQIPAAYRDEALYRGHAESLIACVLQWSPFRTLEIGLGWGFSAACIQAAGSVKHTVVTFDEDERRQAQGVANARLFGAPQLHFESSDRVLPRLLADYCDGFDLVLIDGGHLFDQVFVDLHYSLQLCRLGGLILVDDTWMAPVSTACAWMERNLAHVELVEKIDCLSIYRKRALDKRVWSHWEPFPVTPVSVRP